MMELLEHLQIPDLAIQEQLRQLEQLHQLEQILRLQEQLLLQELAIQQLHQQDLVEAREADVHPEEVQVVVDLLVAVVVEEEDNFQ